MTKEIAIFITVETEIVVDNIQETLLATLYATDLTVFIVGLIDLIFGNFDALLASNFASIGVLLGVFNGGAAIVFFDRIRLDGGEHLTGLLLNRREATAINHEVVTILDFFAINLSDGKG